MGKCQSTKHPDENHQCIRKRTYISRKEARAAIERLRRRASRSGTSFNLVAYICPYCKNAWHIGNANITLHPEEDNALY